MWRDPRPVLFFRCTKWYVHRISIFWLSLADVSSPHRNRSSQDFLLRFWQHSSSIKHYLPPRGVVLRIGLFGMLLNDLAIDDRALIVSIPIASGVVHPDE